MVRESMCIFLSGGNEYIALTFVPTHRQTDAMASSALLFAGLILFGCIANVMTLELLVKTDASSGNLITFFQFLFISAEGLISNLEFGRRNGSWSPVRLKPRHIPIKYYIFMVAIFWTSSMINNWVFRCTRPRRCVPTLTRTRGVCAQLRHLRAAARGVPLV